MSARPNDNASHFSVVLFACLPNNLHDSAMQTFQVVVGCFSEAGFVEQHNFLDQMSIVNSIDWAYSEAQILSGSQDDMALLWDAETFDNVSR